MMCKPYHWAIVSCVLLSMSCLPYTINAQPSQGGILDYVNPFIGTGGHGHTYPGASAPFGMMQLSPDTRLTGWDGCSGYHYSDTEIYGFSHTHLSGTGVSDYGDILLMPVNNGAEIAEGPLEYDDYKSPFSHSEERATAGFYEVYLEKPQVLASLTTSTRGGVHRYLFKNSKQAAVVLDLEHRDLVLSCDFKLVSPTRIEGHRFSNAWAKDQRVFFVMEFSTPFSSYEVKKLEGGNTNAKGIFLFSNMGKGVEVRVAISPVDIEGARKNFDAELKGRSFDDVLNSTQEEWRKNLGKIRAGFLNEEDKVVFYTALYHSMLAPNTYSDVDGRYRGMDMKIHEDKSRTHYTVFSLWDTYRAAHPLYTIIDQKRTNDFIHSMLQKYQQGGMLPIWDLSACYTGCMIGYHGVSVIADAYMKGINDYDAELALEAMVHSANQDHLGLEGYKKHGFIAVEKEAESVSKTLEYAYDDWCIAQMALQMREGDIYQEFSARSLNYRNLFDPETHFFRPRRNNFWLAPFDPYEVNSNYTEANAWHYAFSAVHDMDGFIKLHGGKEQLEKVLDALFEASSNTSGRDQADITGLIGQYAHGNEPSHHIAYLYNYVNKPWKTQERVKEILTTQYRNAPDGIAGNEDCGQMSAWYIMSALGFYPVAPASDFYVIGSPLVKQARIVLENGKMFSVFTKNNDENHPYIQQVILNGKPYPYSYISHEVIMNGGELRIVMGPDPNPDWGSADEHAPFSSVGDATFIPAPYFLKGMLSFEESNTIEIAASQPDSKIYYNIDGRAFKAYNRGIVLKENARVCTYAKKGDHSSPVVCTDFFKRDQSLSIKLESEFAAIYDGGADDALIDGLRAGRDFRTGGWQGFEGQDLVAVVEMDNPKDIQRLSCGFLQDENSWIFFPTKVSFYTSEDGKNYSLFGTDSPSVGPKESGVHLEDITVKGKPVKAKYIKLEAKSLIKCPGWHKGALYDGKAWLFADEIKIN
jgi:predicted alpha-1,2-mannosidase